MAAKFYPRSKNLFNGLFCIWFAFQCTNLVCLLLQLMRVSVCIYCARSIQSTYLVKHSELVIKERKGVFPALRKLV